MAWEETRGSARVVVGAARQLAHADDAKSRADEATRLPTKSLRPRVLVGAGAGAVVLGLVAFLAFRGGDAPAAERAAPAAAKPSPSATPTGPTPADLLAESQPSGDWKLVIFNRTSVTRGGTTTQQKGKSDPATWTFPAAACSDTSCSGTITSTTGREFSFTWTGSRLRVVPAVKVDRSKKMACVDTVTGQEEPIALSAFRTTNHYSLKPFVGSATRMVAQSTTRVTFEVFGTCKVSPQDVVLGTYEWVLTPQE